MNDIIYLDCDYPQADFERMRRQRDEREHVARMRSEYLHTMHRLHVGWTAARIAYLNSKIGSTCEHDALTSIKDFKKKMVSAHLSVMDKVTRK